MRSVELFAGAGGLALGVDAAGFHPEVIVERDADTCMTIRANQARGLSPLVHWKLFEDDIHLIIDEIWVPLAESLLITRFAPIWNQAVDGFGIKTPGRGRIMQKRSEWDVLHAGRNFASGLQDSKRSEQDIRTRVAKHISDFLAQQT